MAIDMFLRLGDILGESKDSEHPDEIDVLAWSWGANSTQSLQVGGGGGRRSGKANFQDLSLTKFVDSSSTDILKLLATGKVVPDAKLTVRKSGEVRFEFLVLDFRPVIVSSISMGGSGGEDRLTENVTLNFAEFKYTYSKQRDDGGNEGSENFAWSIPSNAEVKF